ncbi:MAG: hypothetical protein ABJL99_13100 [Aliishimia sp.]
MTMASEPNQQPSMLFGTTGLILGALALFGILVHFVSGPFAPQQDLGVGLGELAADVLKSAARDLAGREQPAPQPIAWDIDRIFRATAMGASVIALMLGVIALLRDENKRIAKAAMFVGVSAIVVSFFIWTLMLVLGVILVLAFTSMFGDFFSFG